MVVFAAFVVPGNDPISMAVLALVLIVLYEVAVLVAKIHDRRKAAMRRPRPGSANLSDDEASPMPELRGTGRGAEPVEAPTPVTPPSPSGCRFRRPCRSAEPTDGTPDPLSPARYERPRHARLRRRHLIARTSRSRSPWPIARHRRL